MSEVKRCFASLSALILSAVSASPATYVGERYQAAFDGAPLTLATRGEVAGGGKVSADVNGHTLTLNGQFEGLSSEAIAAELHEGLLTGVPGNAFASLSVSKAASGTVSGKVNLSDDQLEALRRGAVYVQIDTAKAADGALRGWLLKPIN